MEYPLRSFIFMALSVLATVILISLSFPLARMARDAENNRRDVKTEMTMLADEREWSKYTGTVSGASMLGFITRHKDGFDIVIRSHSWDSRLAPYLTGNVLILGLSDVRQIPDYFWDTAFLYDVLLNGQGERLYTATLIYTAGTITGIQYEEV